MPSWVRRNYTRWDLRAVPGVVLMVVGLVLEFTVSHLAGSLILFLGIALNTVYVVRRTMRDQRG